MKPIIEKLTGMNALSDQVVAMDLLIAAKSGARNYAMAVTEAGTPEIKELLTRHLMMVSGWLKPLRCIHGIAESSFRQRKQCVRLL